MAQSALRSLTQQLMQGGPAPSGMASAQTAIQNAANRPQPKPMGQQMADVLGGVALPLSAVPIVGDITGLGADAAMYANYPEERTALNYGLTLAGVLPFVPSAAGIRTAGNAAEGALDMSQAARMQRAREQGFLPEVVYHGTGKDFDAFDPGMSTGARYNTGIFVSQSPDVASTYAVGQERQVLPLLYRTEAPIQVFADKANWNRLGPNTRVELPARTVNQSEDADILRALGIEVESSQEMLPRSTTLRELFPEVYGYEDDFIDTNDLSRWAKRQGADAVIFNDILDHGPSGLFSNEGARNPARNIVSFDPANIRSVNAAFDPAKRNSANLTAGIMSGAVGLSALRQLMPQQDQE